MTGSFFVFAVLFFFVAVPVFFGFGGSSGGVGSSTICLDKTFE